MNLINNGYKKLMTFLNNQEIKHLRDEPMKKHTTFGIGGKTDFLIFPQSVKELIDLISLIKVNNLTFYFIGSGSNLLVSDNGIQGIIISLKKSFKKVTFNSSTVYAESGVMLGNFVKQLIARNITGYESLIGVPGTLGGALIMNAGAYGSEISKNLISARTISSNGIIKQYLSSEIEFSYRNSSFKNDEILIDAYFKCNYGNKNKIQENKINFSNKRKQNQPLRFRSAGSIFKNPINNQPAGYLIDKTGLKGIRLGDAEISNKHANFIINHGNAKSKNVIELIRMIQKKVLNKYKVKLELEIKLLGIEL